MWWKILGPFRLIYKIYLGLTFFGVGIVMYPGAFILIQRKQWRNALFFYKRRIWTNLLLLLWLIPRRVIHAEKKTLPEGACVICANHTSYLDIIVLYNLLPGQYIFLAKEEVKKIPFVGLFFRKGVHETVRRGDKTDGARALDKMREKAGEGIPVILFPEGGTTKHPPRMKEFKAGPFKLAIEKQIPIVPVTFINNWQILSSPAKPFGHARPGLSTVVFHPAIDTKGLEEKDLLLLQEQLREVIEAPLKKKYPQYYS